MSTFRCTNCGYQVQRPTQPFSCPQCGRQAVGLFRQVTIGGPAQGGAPAQGTWPAQPGMPQQPQQPGWPQQPAMPQQPAGQWPQQPGMPPAQGGWPQQPAAPQQPTMPQPQGGWPQQQGGWPAQPMAPQQPGGWPQQPAQAGWPQQPAVPVQGGWPQQPAVPPQNLWPGQPGMPPSQQPPAQQPPVPGWPAQPGMPPQQPGGVWPQQQPAPQQPNGGWPGQPGVTSYPPGLAPGQPAPQPGQPGMQPYQPGMPAGQGPMYSPPSGQPYQAPQPPAAPPMPPPVAPPVQQGPPAPLPGPLPRPPAQTPPAAAPTPAAPPQAGLPPPPPSQPRQVPQKPADPPMPRPAPAGLPQGASPKGSPPAALPTPAAPEEPRQRPSQAESPAAPPRPRPTLSETQRRQPASESRNAREDQPAPQRLRPVPPPSETPQGAATPIRTKPQPSPPEPPKPAPRPRIARPERFVWSFPEEPPTEQQATPMHNAPAVDSLGRIYLHTQERLFALKEEDGKVKMLWEYVTGSRAPGPVIVSPDDTIRLHCSDGYLHSIEASSGRQTWPPACVGEPLGYAMPVTDMAGNTWISAADGGLIKVDSMGSVARGRYFRVRQKFDSPGVISHNVLYIGSEGGYMFAIDLSEERGSNLWNHAAEQGYVGGVHAAPAMTAAGMLIVAGQDEHLYGYAPTGVLNWRTQVPGQVLGAPVFDRYGHIYVGVSQAPRGTEPRGLLVCLDGNSHKLRWEYRAAGPVESTPVIGDDDLIYFGDNAGVVHAVTLHGRAQWTVNVGSPVRSAGTILAPQRLAFGLDNETLLVLDCPSKGLAPEGWPKIGRTLGQCGLA